MIFMGNLNFLLFQNDSLPKSPSFATRGYWFNLLDVVLKRKTFMCSSTFLAEKNYLTQVSHP